MYKVICLGKDGMIRREFFDNREDAEQVASFIKDFYGITLIKVVEVEEEEA